MEDRGRECLLDSPENEQERQKQVSEDGGQCQNISNFNNNIRNFSNEGKPRVCTRESGTIGELSTLRWQELLTADGEAKA